MKKYLCILFICLFQSLFLLGILHAQGTRSIILNGAVDKRELNYDEKDLFEDYGGLFLKEQLIGTYSMLSPIFDLSNAVGMDPIVINEPIDIIITRTFKNALNFCNFEIIDHRSKSNSITLDIDINNLFVTPSSQRYDIKISLKSPADEILLEKTFFHDVYFQNYQFTTSSAIVNYFSNILLHQLAIFFQSDEFLEAYSGRKLIFKDFSDFKFLDSEEDNIMNAIPTDVNCLYLANAYSLDNLKDVNKFKNLYELSIAQDFSAKFPQLDELKNLKFLTIKQCKFLNNLENIKALENLEYLNISFNNKLNKFKGINSLKNLKFLAINYDDQNKITEDFRGLNNLIILDLEDNKIKKIQNLEDMQKLNALYLGSNSISKIENMEAQTNLSTLNLAYNKVNKIENISHLSNLASLSLSYNPISKIDSLSDLSNLEELFLDGTNIKKIENLNKLVNLKTLSLGSANIGKIENLEDLVNLENLNLAYNKNINKIENIDNFIKLKVLNLSGTSIKEIEGINNFISLEELYLKETKTKELNNIENLKNLKILDISGTKIKSLKIIENFPELTVLDISESKIEKLESIEKCPKLTKIRAKKFQVDYISRASYEYLKKKGWTFLGNLTIDEFVKKQFIKIVD